jgi:3-deoxy-D-manno-octulosonic-acid transferase
VPRHVERSAEVAGLLEAKGVRWQKRSRLEADGADPQARVLLVDTTGELSRWWGTATLAFVGGSLDGKRGGQNMLEPAAYGVPICFGPHTWNFREEVAMLLAAGGAEVVHDGRELEAFVQRAVADRSWSDSLASAARSLVEANRGAVRRTAERVVDRLRQPSPPDGRRRA